MSYSFKRNISMQDLEDIGKWTKHIYEEVNNTKLSQAWIENNILLINNGNIIVGFCALNSTSKGAQLQLIRIRNNYRRQKLGTLLVEYCLLNLKKIGTKSLEVNNVSIELKPFWNKLGFKAHDCNSNNASIKMYINLTN
ncbi:MAG: GNAT family N-acetyltransferase [Winogradskyella sp.]